MDCGFGNRTLLIKSLMNVKMVIIVFYADSGAFFVKKINKLISSLRKDEKIWVSDCPLLESCFTKQICFEKMECDKKEFKNSNQIQATYLMLVCCEETKAFIKKWLHYCEDYELMSPEGGLSLNENRGTQFVAHREDQSILSLLCQKNGIKPHKDPSQRGEYPETFIVQIMSIVFRSIKRISMG